MQPEVTIGIQSTWRPISDVEYRLLKHMGACKKLTIRGKNWTFWKQWRSSFIETFSPLDRMEILRLGISEHKESSFRLGANVGNVLLASIRFGPETKTFTSFPTIMSREGDIRAMPSRFSYMDIRSRLRSVRSWESLRNVLYLHLISGELEYIPNYADPSNPSFYKTGNFLTDEIYE